MIAGVERVQQASLWSAEPPVLQEEGEILPKNRFVGFIGDNREAFNRLATATRLLREEERGWRDSPVVDQFLENIVEAIAISASNAPVQHSARDFRRKTEEFKRQIREEVFGGSATNSVVFSRQMDQLKNKLGSESKAKLLQLNVALIETINDYREATKPIVEEIKQTRLQLLSKFWDFLREDHRSFFDFVEFLKDRKNPERNRAKVFLEGLAQIENAPKDPKRPNKIEQITKESEAEILKSPSSEIIAEFSQALRSSPTIKEWLSFVLLLRGVEGVEEITDEDIARLLKSVSSSIWPSDLRDSFSSFVSAKFASSFLVMRSELVEFDRKAPRPAINTFPPVQTVSVKRNHSEGNGKNGTSQQAVVDSVPIVEKEQKQQYTVGLIQKAENPRGNSIVVLEEKDVVLYLSKHADKFAPGDIRIAKDFEKILKSIQVDPYGMGVKKLTDKTITIEKESIPLRSFNPRRRLGINLEHPGAMEIRFVFAIKDGTVAIEGIYTHDEYDKKFA